jgi:hypothetical protein
VRTTRSIHCVDPPSTPRPPQGCVVGLGIALVLGLTPLVARADCDARLGASTCISADALWPTPGDQRFVYVAEGRVTPPRRFAISLVSSYQSKPIVLRVATPGREGTESHPIDDQLGATLGLSFGILPRLAALVAIPATLYQSGGGSEALTGRSPPASAGLRDPRVGAAVAIVARNEGGLAAIADVQFPTRSGADFGGEKGFVFSPTMAGHLRPLTRLEVAANVGARLRPVGQEFVGERQGTQGLASLGTSVDVVPQLLSIGAEARLLLGFAARADVTQARTGLTSGESHAIVGGEWLGALRASLFAGALTVLGGGGGTLPLDGLVGIGRLRFVLGITYAPPVRVEDTKPSPVDAPPAASEPETPPTPVARPARPPAPPPPLTSETPPAPPKPKAPRGTCVTRCTADTPLAPGDEADLVSRVEPLLKDLRTCLSRVGGEGIDPVVLLRFSQSGQPANVRVDVGGYEDLSCVKEASGRAPGVRSSRPTTARCQLHCE